jgi:hypothetical protein
MQPAHADIIVGQCTVGSTFALPLTVPAPTFTSWPLSDMRLHCMLVIFSQCAGSLLLYLSPMYFLMAARLEPERCTNRSKGCSGVGLGVSGAVLLSGSPAN